MKQQHVLPTMNACDREIALHSTTKRDHRAQYRPSRRSNHCLSESYLRPDQAAQSLFFEYISDYKKPTIRSVHHRRLTKRPSTATSTSNVQPRRRLRSDSSDVRHRDSLAAKKRLAAAKVARFAHAAASANEEYIKTEAALVKANEETDLANEKFKKATAWSIRCTSQYTATAKAEVEKARTEQIMARAKDARALSVAKEAKEIAMQAAARARQHIERGAETELNIRVSRNFNKVNVLVGELAGVDIKDMELEDDHILSSTLVGSPRKSRGPRRQTAKEIIERRKKRYKALQSQLNAMAENDPSEIAFKKQQLEKAEKRRLGLERQERCWMCQEHYPKGTMQDEVIKKCIYKWRQQQKAVRRYKKLIRTAIQGLGDGGAAVVFRFANKTTDVPVVQSKKTRSMVHLAKSKFLKMGKTKQVESGSSASKTLNYKRQRPATAASRSHGTESPRKRKLQHKTRPSSSSSSLHRFSSTPSTPSTPATTNATPASLSRARKLSRSSQFKRAAPGSISFDQFFQAMDQMFSINIYDVHVKEELLKWLDRDRGGDLSFHEFQHLVHVGGVDNLGRDHYLATPGSERRPQLALENLDATQTEMLDVPMRLIHTLYEKVSVCSFCMQILHQFSFRDDAAPTANRRNTKNAPPSMDGRIEWENPEENPLEKHRLGENGSASFPTRALPTTLTTRHNPWRWDDIREQILNSFVARRAVAPFETWQEHEDVGMQVQHYMSFNHVPMPSRKGGRLPVEKQTLLVSKSLAAVLIQRRIRGLLARKLYQIRLKKSQEGTQKMLETKRKEKHSIVPASTAPAVQTQGRLAKNSMEEDLLRLYKAYKKCGKSLEHYEHTGSFKDSEEKFYTLQARHLNTSLLKKRRAVMATEKDLDVAASKLQAVMRGRNARKEENEKRERKNSLEKQQHEQKLLNYRMNMRIQQQNHPGSLHISSKDRTHLHR